MRALALILVTAVLAGCGSDTVSDRTASIGQQNVLARDAAQAGRIDNPAALACIRANASEAEWAVIETETDEAPAVLQSVLNREGTQRCFSINNVVIYL